MIDAFLHHMPDNPVERDRYIALKRTLASLSDIFAKRRVLDFGASHGMSAAALVELGAREVVGVETDAKRVEQGRDILRRAGYGERIALHHAPDTRNLVVDGRRVSDDSFDVVLANAVLEHIPCPRAPYVREMWRVLAPDGFLVVNETPNKYLPLDYHTTGLLWVPWLPRQLARRYAIWRGRFSATEDWASSGWRGLGYYELTAAIPGRYELIPETPRARHRVFAVLGVPPSLLDPYPTLVFRKRPPEVVAAPTQRPSGLPTRRYGLRLLQRFRTRHRHSDEVAKTRQ